MKGSTVYTIYIILLFAVAALDQIESKRIESNRVESNRIELN